jgi:hypothetical protein
MGMPIWVHYMGYPGAYRREAHGNKGGGPRKNLAKEGKAHSGTDILLVGHIAIVHRPGLSSETWPPI